MVIISIIVPCYNQAQYLDECLQSVLDQTFSDWECIIVNDGSPDNTEEVARKWIEKDQRFKYLEQKNKGVSAARNFGIENAVGEWILPLDADDFISNEYLLMATSFFEDTNIKVIYCNAKKVGKVNQDFILQDFTLNNIAINNVIFCTAFFRKRDCIEIGGFDEAMHFGYEDWEFWIRLLKDGGKVKKVDIYGFFYRIKEESRNVSVKNDSESTLKYIERKHIEFFHEQLGTINGLYKENLENAKTIDVVINKRRFSRIVNQLYSVIDRVTYKNK